MSGNNVPVQTDNNLIINNMLHSKKGVQNEEKG